MSFIFWSHELLLAVWTERPGDWPGGVDRGSLGRVVPLLAPAPHWRKNPCLRIQTMGHPAVCGQRDASVSRSRIRFFPQPPHWYLIYQPWNPARRIFPDFHISAGTSELILLRRKAVDRFKVWSATCLLKQNKFRNTFCFGEPYAVQISRCGLLLASGTSRDSWQSRVRQQNCY